MDTCTVFDTIVKLVYDTQTIIDTIAVVNPQSTSKWEYVTGSVAIVSACLNIVLLWYIHHTNKEFNEASSKPLLWISKDLGSNSEYNGLFIANKGLGPAIIKSAKIIHTEGNQQKLLDNRIAYAKLRSDLRTLRVNLDYHSIGKDDVIAPNEKIWLFRAVCPEDRERQKMEDLIKNIAVEVEYESTYKKSQNISYPNESVL